jgi:hypothetical protein
MGLSRPILLSSNTINSYANNWLGDRVERKTNLSKSHISFHQPLDEEKWDLIVTYESSYSYASQ